MRATVWDYRVFERQTSDGSAEFFIGEAYYDENDVVVGWTGPVEVIGEATKASLRKELMHMMAALGKPTLQDTETQKEGQ